MERSQVVLNTQWLQEVRKSRLEVGGKELSLWPTAEERQLDYSPELSLLTPLHAAMKRQMAPAPSPAPEVLRSNQALAQLTQLTHAGFAPRLWGMQHSWWRTPAHWR